MAVVELEGVAFSYPNQQERALDGVRLAIGEGEIHGLLGPNGAGKTTLVRILGGLLRPSEGGARVLGADPATREAKRRIGYCPQELALFPALTALETLRLFAGLAGVARSRCGVQIESALALVGLQPHRGRRVEHFSGGMKRRLNLAIAVLHEPRFLLLDEPTAGVDAQSRALLFESLEAIRASGTAILYTTHYLEEAERLCGTISIIDHGRIVLTGSREDLLGEEEATLYRAEFDAPIPRGLAEALRGAGLEVVTEEAAAIEIRAHEASRALRAIGECCDRERIGLVRFARRRHTLESRFLQLTGREMRD